MNWAIVKYRLAGVFENESAAGGRKKERAAESAH
jgi:hypothetical protein